MKNDSIFGCRVEYGFGFGCDQEEKEKELRNALESCPDFYKNSTNRLKIKPEVEVRPKETRLEFYYNVALVAGFVLD